MLGCGRKCFGVRRYLWESPLFQFLKHLSHCLLHLQIRNDTSTLQELWVLLYRMYSRMLLYRTYPVPVWALSLWALTNINCQKMMAQTQPLGWSWSPILMHLCSRYSPSGILENARSLDTKWMYPYYSQIWTCKHWLVR